MIWRMIADPVKRVLIFLTVGIFICLSIYLWFETGRLRFEAEYYKIEYENCINQKGE